MWWRSAFVGALCLSCGLVLAGQPSGPPLLYACATMILAYLGATTFAREKAMRRLADRLDAATVTTTTGRARDRLASAVTLVEQGLASDYRIGQRHSLTGLPTREPLIAQMIEDRRGTLGVIGLIDFDRLCAFDLALGERVLSAIVDRLTRMLPPTRLIAHVDRANLAIWFGPDIDQAAAKTQIDAIGYALGDSIEEGGTVILPEIRVRLAALDGNGGNPQAVLARTLARLAIKSDTAVAKAAPTIDPAVAARDRYVIEQDLRQAIGRGELAMHYQPLIDAGEGRVCGAEALIRWHHPVRGTIAPARFVPVMEAIGLAHEIGMWTLNAAAREAYGWQAQGFAALRVAVNLSGHQIDRSDLAALVERTLARHSLGPDALEIELTESVAMGDGERAAKLFQSLRKMGVRIAIDDFGTGYSSFSTLRTLAFDKIKIDREFVTNIDTRRDSQAICQSIIALGRGLGISVLAEGVERREEYEWLRRHGCTHFQGYYFSPPLAGGGFTDFVRDTNGLAAKLELYPPSTRRKITERLTA